MCVSQTLCSEQKAISATDNQHCIAPWDASNTLNCTFHSSSAPSTTKPLLFPLLGPRLLPRRGLGKQPNISACALAARTRGPQALRPLLKPPGGGREGSQGAREWTAHLDTSEFIYSQGGGGGERGSFRFFPRSCPFLADKVIFWLVPGAQGRVWGEVPALRGRSCPVRGIQRGG